jgi:predicted ATPase
MRSASDALILTPDQRLRVFVSSTLAELADERRAVERAVSAMGLTPVMFESGARPHPAQELYRAYLVQSDIFIGLYWQRYGQLAPGLQVSGLEEEFDLSSALPRLLYVKTPAPDREPHLSALLSRVRGQASYRRFGTAEELEQLVRQDLATLLSERFAAARSLAEIRASVSAGRAMRHGYRPLPVSTTSLVGRERAIEELAGLVGRADARLVTLTGPGGVGKTRLALAAGERLRDRFSDGTVFASLASVSDPHRLMGEVCRAVGAELTDAGAALEVLVELFGEGTWLLILDNLEQLVGAARDLDELLSRCPGVAILATSRTVLGLRAEHEYPVQPLSLPDDPAGVSVEELASSPAVTLFLERARMVRHDFALTPDNASAVAAICRRLEGLPLAIELAAARTRLLDPGMLLDRLVASLDALGTGMVDLPERQRTLRATVDWSVGLLDAAERSLLETVTVFVDGWTIEAAAQVAGLQEDRVLELTEALARHSLVQIDGSDNGPRSRLLETVREFVSERLSARDDFAEVQRRHAEYYRRLVEQSDRRLRGAAHGDWLELMDLESGNLAAAVRWFLDHDSVLLPHMFRILYPVWALRDRIAEARGWVQRLLPSLDHLSAEPQAELLWAALVTAVETGDDQLALAVRGQLAPMLAGIQDPYLRAVAELVTAWAAPIAGDFDGALESATQALARLRQLDESYWTAIALATAGFLETGAGRYEEAVARLREARVLSERSENPFLTAVSRIWLGCLAVALGRREEARVLLAESLDLSLASHSTHTVSLCLVSMARLAFSEGEVEWAAQLTGAAEGLRRRAGVKAWPPLRRGEAQLAAELRESLGTDRFGQAFAAGSRLNLHEAVAAVRSKLHADAQAV